MSTRDRLLAALVAVLWGLNFVVIDLGLGDVPPLVFVAVRFVVVAVPAILLVPRPDVPWRVLVGVGLTMSLGQFTLLYLALALGMPPGLAGLVLQAQVVLTILISTAVLGERPTRGQAVGVALGVAALAVIAAGRGGHVPLIGLVLTLLAALSWACGNVLVRAARVPAGLGMTVWSALVVPVPALGLAVAVDGPGVLADAVSAFGWAAALSTLYTAVLASLVGYSLFNGLLGRWPAADVVPWILLVPVVSIASAAVVLGERPSAGEVLGGLLLMVAVLVALRSPRQPQVTVDDDDVATVAVAGGLESPRTAEEHSTSRQMAT